MASLTLLIIITFKFCLLSLEMTSAVISTTSSPSASSSSAASSASSTFYNQSREEGTESVLNLKVSGLNDKQQRCILNITSALWSTERALLSFNNLLQRLFLLVSLEHLPRYRVVLHLQLPSARLFCFFKRFFCIPIKKKGALNGNKETSLHFNTPSLFL